MTLHEALLAMAQQQRVDAETNHGEAEQKTMMQAAHIVEAVAGSPRICQRALATPQGGTFE